MSMFLPEGILFLKTCGECHNLAVVVIDDWQMHIYMIDYKGGPVFKCQFSATECGGFVE